MSISKKMRIRRMTIVLLFCFLIPPPCLIAKQKTVKDARPYILVLGIAQDGGVPQAGTKEHAGWSNKQFHRNVVCLALVDPQTKQRWMFEATPDFRTQLHLLDADFPVPDTPGLDGIFITHAHIGHYTGLMFLGHESLGSENVPVYVMPKMQSFLSHNGPWDQLVRYKNIKLLSLHANEPVVLNKHLSVTPIPVPHRQEYSEVVGFKIQGPNKSILFIPDIDSWEELDAWGVHIEDLIKQVDVAFLDGTFFANGEIPGRDMSGFPHPFIKHSMQRFGKLEKAQRKKIWFIHLNHTNLALWKNSREWKQIEANGFNLAQELQRFEL